MTIMARMMTRNPGRFPRPLGCAYITCLSHLVASVVCGAQAGPRCRRCRPEQGYGARLGLAAPKGRPYNGGTVGINSKEGVWYETFAESCPFSGRRRGAVDPGGEPGRVLGGRGTGGESRSGGEGKGAVESDDTDRRAAALVRQQWHLVHRALDELGRVRRVQARDQEWRAHPPLYRAR